MLTQILKHSGREEQAFLTKSCRTAAGIVLDRTIYLGIVFNDEGFVCIIGGSMDILKIAMIGMAGVLSGNPIEIV